MSNDRPQTTPGGYYSTTFNGAYVRVADLPDDVPIDRALDFTGASATPQDAAPPASENRG